MATLNVKDYDIIYLSYDEPNAEENYYDLLQRIPWAKRIHGIEGSDAAHKACANLANTDRFITVDGDNRVVDGFIDEKLYFEDDIDLDKCVVSWSGYNVINGLTYGNGGIKCWPKDLVLNMRTHEHADPDDIQSQVDFCWNLQYLQINKIFSTVHNNSTPQQAWRAGYREGVKMCLLEGSRTDKVNRIPKKNLDRLRIWQTVGMDVENGIWAIYGAREGAYKTLCTDWDYVNVRDFEYLNNLWTDKKDIQEKHAYEYSKELGDKLINETGIEIPQIPYEKDQSKFFKSLYVPPKRVIEDYSKPKVNNVYDIVMITYNETNAEKNYQALLDRFPRAKRVDGIKGIHQAHIQAAKICKTDLIWIVDGDALVADDFNFDYVAPDNEKHYVKVWRSRNPINDLEYGYGGIKLFPRQATIDMDVTKPDMTTSISRHFKPIKVVSNITAFNTSPFETWKSAFRECAKLSSKVIDRQKTGETDERLKTWTTVGHDRPFGKYALAGATAGMEFGLSGGSDLRLINDFNWLQQQFDLAYPDVKDTQDIEIDKNLDSDIVDVLDRFELLYDNMSNVRRLYNDKDMSSLFKIADNEEMRKAVMEKNLHSIFRLIDTDEDLRKAVVEKNNHSLFRLLGDEYEDLRKAVVENNIHSLFRLLGDEYEDLRKAVTEENVHALFRLLGHEYEDLRKAITEENIHALFRVLGNDYEDLRKAITDENLYSIFRITKADPDLRKAVTEENLHSIARLLPQVADEFKLLENDKNALWRVLEKYTNSLFVEPLKKLYDTNTSFDLDCFSRGQVASKKWLVDVVKDLHLDLGTVFLCAGWYATIVPMMSEAGVNFKKIRSFDIDESVWKIAETFNMHIKDDWIFKAQTKDIMDINYIVDNYTTVKGNGDIEDCKDAPDTIINTSCEHIKDFDKWYSKIPDGKLVILQSNNYYSIEEHVNCVDDNLHFEQMAPLSEVYFAGDLPLEKYTRYMRIGRK